MTKGRNVLGIKNDEWEKVEQACRKVIKEEREKFPIKRVKNEKKVKGKKKDETRGQKDLASVI